MASKTPCSNKSYSDIEITHDGFIKREHLEDFEKFHKYKTKEQYETFRNKVKDFGLRKDHRDELFALTGHRHYGGDLRLSDQNVRLKLHSLVHNGLLEYFFKLEERRYFYFVTIVDDSWIYSFDEPKGNFFDINNRVRRVVNSKEGYSAFGLIEFDVMKNCHLYGNKRALSGHVHMVLSTKNNLTEKEVEISLKRHFKSKKTKRKIHASKIDYSQDMQNVFKIASYISKMPPCAKLRWEKKGSKGVYTKLKPVRLAPKEVFRLMEVYSEIHVNSLFIGAGKEDSVGKELKKLIKSKFTSWHHDQIERDKLRLGSKFQPYSSRKIYLPETREVWVRMKKRYKLYDMPPSELVYVKP